MNLLPHERRVYSQHGEDGIIAWLIEKLDPMKYFVEFGAEDGRECNTRLLAEQNWRGLQIEAREDCWRDLADLNRTHRQRVHSVCEKLDLDNLEDVFAGVPKCFGVLVVDVDGNDFYFVRAIVAEWAPSIVCVEVNHRVDETKPFVQPYQPDKVWNGVSERFGSSLASMTAMMRENGYALVGTEKEHVNAFYVRDEDVERLK